MNQLRSGSPALAPVEVVLFLVSSLKLEGVL